MWIIQGWYGYLMELLWTLAPSSFQIIPSPGAPLSLVAGWLPFLPAMPLGCRQEDRR